MKMVKHQLDVCQFSLVYIRHITLVACCAENHTVRLHQH